MSRYDFLCETYRTERLKTLGVWAQVPDDRMDWRAEPRARTPHEHMVHQCVSEDGWMRKMLGIESSRDVLPPVESRLDFMRHYAAVSAERLSQLEEKPDEWYEEEVDFFDVRRSRAWIMTRRLTHTSHHRGQQMAMLRMLGRDLHSNYGPTADTGGLMQDHAPTIYAYASVEALLEAESRGGGKSPLPEPQGRAVTERP